MRTLRSGFKFKGLTVSLLLILLAFPLPTDARETPQLTSLEAIDLAFDEALKWDRNAFLWYVTPPGRMLDQHWAENDLSWDWTVIFVRSEDNKSYRVRIINDKVTESVEEKNVSREEPIPVNTPSRGGIVSLKEAAAVAFREGAPPLGRPMVVYNTPGKWTGGRGPQWEFLFGSVYRIYRVDALTGELLEVIQFDPETNERLDHLLDTAEMVLALEKSGEIFIYRFFEAIDKGDHEYAIKMMDPDLAGNDQTKEMWKSNFASLDLIRVVSIIPESGKKWHNGRPLFEVTVFTRPDTAKGFFGWEEGFDTRWISLVQTGDGWKVTEMATSP